MIQTWYLLIITVYFDEWYAGYSSDFHHSFVLKLFRSTVHVVNEISSLVSQSTPCLNHYRLSKYMWETNLNKLLFFYVFWHWLLLKKWPFKKFYISSFNLEFPFSVIKLYRFKKAYWEKKNLLICVGWFF